MTSVKLARLVKKVTVVVREIMVNLACWVLQAALGLRAKRAKLGLQEG